MLFSDEELIAYLLGDATAELGQRLELALAVDSDLLQRLATLRQMLGQIDSPTGCSNHLLTWSIRRSMRIDQTESSAWATADMLQPTYLPSFADNCADSKPLVHRVCLSSSLAAPPRRCWPWDSAALTISLTILCCLALPALLRARFESRKCSVHEIWS